MLGEISRTIPNAVPVIGNTPGSGFLWGPEEVGWSNPPLYLPLPLLLLRVTRQGTRVETPDGTLIAQHEDRIVVPFQWMEEIFHVLSDASRGTERRQFLRPSSPFALVGVSYEYGSTFHPHEGCFPHQGANETDELFVAFHTTGFAWIKEQWRLFGRPPGRNARWRDWSISREGSDWPAPPGTFTDIENLISKVPTGADDVSMRGTPQMSKEQYCEAVKSIYEHLKRGDIYQANLSVRFDAKVTATADQIFAAGLAAGGDRYCAMLRGRGQSHISFSPELMLRRWGRSLITKPIKGTRPRTGIPDHDMRLAQELLDSEKDSAEHIMIVDLERNDMGRLCEFGSVRVDPMMETTWHPSVLHMESTVFGTMRSTVQLRDILSAMFPGGSVTGAPKKRAMEIIGELEKCPRGIYCGALGWVDSRGDCEFNLPIRTSTLHDDGRLFMHAGSGIVADSDPEMEWAEVQGKLRFMESAVRLACLMHK